MAELPEPKEMEIMIGGRKEKIKYSVDPGEEKQAPFVMIIPRDKEQRARLTVDGIQEELDKQVSKKTGLQKPIVAVQGPRIVKNARGGISYE